MIHSCMGFVMYSISHVKNWMLKITHNAFQMICLVNGNMPAK